MKDQDAGVYYPPKLTKEEEVAAILYVILQGITDNPEQIRVNIRQGEQTTVYEVSAVKSDIGKIIGKQGKMAMSIRTILMALMTKYRFRAVMEILE